MSFRSGSTVKHPAAMQEPQEARVGPVSQEGPPEEGLAAHAGILARRSHGQRSLAIGSARVRHG